MRILRAAAAAFTAFMFLSTASGLMAAEEVNTNANGFAIHGYDPVAYHLDNKAVAGTAAFATTFDGARYKFSSKENMDAFQSDPVKYAPAYGGWCAYGVRVGKKFDVSPQAFKVVKGRLYLQLDQGTQKVWIKDLDRNIAIADRLWPNLKKKSRAMLGN